MKHAKTVEREWVREEGVTCVVCPVCSFTFDAKHTTQPQLYDCPCCNEADLEGERDLLIRELLQTGDLLGKLMAVLGDIVCDTKTDPRCGASNTYDDGLSDQYENVINAIRRHGIDLESMGDNNENVQESEV